jgi:3-hydroxybutyryl-CoA dehydratase
VNEYALKDLKVGISHSFNVTITSAMIETFREISGDENPLHIDQEFAFAQGFPRRVAYGMLTSSFYSTLVGIYLPGKYALFQGIDVSFINPVFEDDVLTIYGEITEVHEVYKQIEIKCHITNQNGKKISRGKIRSGVYQ